MHKLIKEVLFCVSVGLVSGVLVNIIITWDIFVLFVGDNTILYQGINALYYYFYVDPTIVCGGL